MKMDLEEHGGVSVLVLSGNLTSGAAKSFRESIDTILGSGRSLILLDVGDVDYMDSAGIGELVAGFKTVKRFEGALKILNPSPRVADSLAVTRLLPMFEVFNDRDEALASFEAAEG